MDKKFTRIQLVSVILLFALCLFSILNLASASMSVIDIAGGKLEFKSNKLYSNLPRDVYFLLKLILSSFGIILPLVFVVLISKDKVNAPRMFLIDLIYNFAYFIIMSVCLIIKFRAIYGKRLENKDFNKTINKQLLGNYGYFMIVFLVLFVVGLIVVCIKKLSDEQVANVIMILSAICIAIIFSWLVYKGTYFDKEAPVEILRINYIDFSALTVFNLTTIASTVSFNILSHKHN